MEKHAILMFVLGIIMLIAGILITVHYAEKLKGNKDKIVFVTDTKEWKEHDSKLMECAKESTILAKLTLNDKFEEAREQRKKLNVLIKERDSLKKLIPYERYK